MREVIPESPGANGVPLPPSSSTPAPYVQCDDCQATMPIPPHCIEAGVILGRLVCSLCTEDRLEAEAYVRSCQ